jgi:hypothetical protein
LSHFLKGRASKIVEQPFLYKRARKPHVIPVFVLHFLVNDAVQVQEIDALIVISKGYLFTDLEQFQDK